MLRGPVPYYLSLTEFSKSLELPRRGLTKRHDSDQLPDPDICIGNNVVATGIYCGWSQKRVDLYREFMHGLNEQAGRGSNVVSLPRRAMDSAERPEWWKVDTVWLLCVTEVASMFEVGRTAITAQLRRGTFPVPPMAQVGSLFGWDLHDIVEYRRQNPPRLRDRRLSQISTMPDRAAA